jgi:arsenite methyltransferase
MCQPEKKNHKMSIMNVYSSIAGGPGRSCCCSTDHQNTAIKLGYAVDTINKVPKDANLGLGCGNPVELASIKKGETVLDLGSGAGFDCFIASREVGDEGTVIGVDMTPEMIEKAKENALEAQINNVDFRLGEIENLPVADNSIDVVISNCVVNLSTDKQAAYNEMFRVLKPGGRVIISDILSRLPLPDSVREDSTLVAGCIGGAISAAELHPIIEKSGFTDISLTPKSNSDEIITGWQPGKNIEEYVFSAYILARKPIIAEKGNVISSKEYFENVASDWDQMREGFFPDSVRDAAYGLSGIQPGQIAADIGAGTGFIAEGLLKRGVNVIAVDQSPAMLNRMREKFKNYNTIEYRVGESVNLPIGDNSVDAAFANMYLHHTESPPDAIQDMTRILKPGGVLVITDLDEHNYNFLLSEQHDRWMGFDRSDIRHWFERAGLQQINVECVGDNCCSASSATNEEARISIFIATGIKIGERSDPS